MFLTLLFFAASGAGQAATITAASPARIDVATAIAVAVDGDTVIIPAGTASWTSKITVTKGITIQGQTTTNSASGTANDQTIIIDNLVRVGGGQGFFECTMNASQSLRISGITFTALYGGLTTIMANGAIKVGGSSYHFRIDHCHFTHIAQDRMISIYGEIFGVSDHNVFDDFLGQYFSHVVQMSNYGGGGNDNGDGAWAEQAGFGGPKFFFIEDNYIYLSYYWQSGGGGVDSLYGGKYVFRHNHVWNATTLGHSTGSGTPRSRGVRAIEVYSNDWHFANFGGLDGTTGGSMLFHDNTFDGTLVIGPHLQVYREIWSYGTPFYGGDGSSVWDYNVTESDGTHVDGHPPYLFESGTATLGTTTTLTDTTKSWTTNQWSGYGLKRLSDGSTGMIQSNTSNTLKIATWQPVNWSAGDSYQIHKPLIILDQPGRGAGDLLSGDPPTPTGWPHQAQEPCYSWNNIYTPNGTHLNFVLGTGSATIHQGSDYFNDTAMPGYTPYTYPHPLVSGAAPTPAPPPGAPTNLRIMTP